MRRQCLYRLILVLDCSAMIIVTHYTSEFRLHTRVLSVFFWCTLVLIWIQQTADLLYELQRRGIRRDNREQIGNDDDEYFLLSSVLIINQDYPSEEVSVFKYHYYSLNFRYIFITGIMFEYRMFARISFFLQ